MTDTQKTKFVWLCVTLAVMLFLPFAVAKLASECAGMALCMMVFFIVNPLYSAVLGFVCGKNIREMWWQPLVAAVAFLAGVWAFYDMGEMWFIAYAAVYLVIGWGAMGLGKCLLRA